MKDREKGNLLTRRAFVGLASAAAAGALIGFEGFYAELRDVRAETIVLHLPRLPEAFEGFRIAHLTDLHYAHLTPQEAIDRAVRLAASWNPDLVALTGDYVTGESVSRQVARKRAEQSIPCGEKLCGAGANVIAVLGNHDHGTNADMVSEGLASHGIRVLRNQAIPLERDGRRLWIAGIDDVVFGKARLQRTMSSVPPSEPTVLLAHEPDIADEAAQLAVDLQLSGHSHGGQVRLPGIGPLWLPRFARKYPAGHYQVRNLQVYTSRGIGVVGIPVRFYCPPEVALIELRRKTS